MMRLDPRPVLTNFLHPGRRRRAEQAIARGAPVESLLFICHGNICRSPYAAESMVRLLREQADSGSSLKVDSAGFVGPGRPSPPEAISAAWARGVNLSGHVSKVLSKDAVRSASWVLVMDPTQARALSGPHGIGHSKILLLGDFDPEPSRERTIFDPWNHPEAVFASTYARIDRCLEQVLRAMPVAKQALGTVRAG